MASGYGQLKLVLILDAAIDEEGLGGVQGTDAAVWATISSQHNGEEAREGQNRNLEGEEEAQGGEVGVRLGNVSQAHDTMAGKHAIRTRGGLVWCDVCGAYGVERSGSRLMGACQPRATRHAATRLERLRRGNHPITGEALT